MAKLYGSVNGETKQITKLYGSSEALTDISYHISGSGPISSFSRSTFLSGFLAAYPAYKWKSNGELSSVALSHNSPTLYTLDITTTNGTLTVSGLTSSTLSSTWGITLGAGMSGAAGYTFTPSYTNQTREVTKLYGSASGLTKQIF